MASQFANTKGFVVHLSTHSKKSQFSKFPVGHFIENSHMTGNRQNLN